MTVVVASANPGKVQEITVLLHSLDKNIHVTSVRELLGPSWYVEESGSTLEENAYVKATAVWEHTMLPTISDDTGLEVFALDGKPGVLSARFAGEHATAEQNNALLLRLLEGIRERQARFRTVLCYRDSLRTIFAEGVCHGTIAFEPSGSGGFGYDPVFIPEGHDQTFAQMTLDKKNQHSHRMRALNALHTRLTALWT